MTPAARSALAAFCILAIVGLAWPAPIPDERPDSYGRTGQGQRALFDLFHELGIEVARSAARSAERSPQATVWFVQPWPWCDLPGRKGRRARDADEDPGPDRGWLERGGTAVVVLPAWLPSAAWSWQVEDLSDAPPDCSELSGVPLPARQLGLAAAGTGERPAGSTVEGSEDSEDPSRSDAAELFGRWWQAELDRSPLVRAFPEQHLEGALVPAPRSLPTRPLLRFAALERGSGFEVVARLDGEPFALERKIGAGRLVVLADAGFLLNRWLDVGDSAPFAVDLARAYGAPVFDERIHGHVAAPALLPYLAASPAFPVLIGLVMLGFLLWAHGSAWPVRDVVEHDAGAPALEPFVEALAGLYESSRDWRQVARRYRSLSVARLRRHFAFPADLPETRLVDRLRREVPAERLRWLAPETADAVVSQADFEAVVHRLDELVTEVCS